MAVIFNLYTYESDTTLILYEYKVDREFVNVIRDNTSYAYFYIYLYMYIECLDRYNIILSSEVQYELLGFSRMFRLPCCADAERKRSEM